MKPRGAAMGFLLLVATCAAARRNGLLASLARLSGSKQRPQRRNAKAVKLEDFNVDASFK
jgi:hypothetical protein